TRQETTTSCSGACTNSLMAFHLRTSVLLRDLAFQRANLIAQLGRFLIFFLSDRLDQLLLEAIDIHLNRYVALDPARNTARMLSIPMHTHQKRFQRLFKRLIAMDA